MSSEDDKLHHEAAQLIGGVFLAGSSFVRLLDRPGMTIELLRATQQARIFREQMQRFEEWMLAAIAAAPAGFVSPEELQELLGEIHRSK